jgi:hypothetical protein
MKKCSPSLAIKEMQIQKSYVLPHMDYRPKTNAVILLDMGHTLRGEHTWEE